MLKPRRIKITGFHEEDAFHGSKYYIGMTGTFLPTPPHNYPGYYQGRFSRDGEDDNWLFVGVRYVKL